MKKITLLFSFLIVCSFSFAQTTVWSDNFDDEDISDWTLIDDDGDGNNWSVVQIVDDNDVPIGTPQLRSASWNGVPLTPDNWIIAPVIDLTSASGTITLDWQVKASDANFDAENYTVYIATANTIAAFLASSTSFNEPSLDGINVLTDRSLDISSFAGEATVYVAFRHFDVSDEFTMEVDNVAVAAETVLNVDEFNINQFSFRFNKDSKTLNLDSPNININSVEIYSILGQSVLFKSMSNTQASVNVSSLNDGVYLAKVNINGNFKTIKFVKN